MMENDKCDKYDYLTAVACGALGGLIDIIFVGTPEMSSLNKLSNKAADNIVKKFAKMLGCPGDTTSAAIDWLEKHFKVNYDQRTSAEVGGKVELSTYNHHFKSLEHSPDIIGLFFCILNQFTHEAHFSEKGKVVPIYSSPQGLQGTDFLSKVFCGFVNWICHIMSDFNGSSGAKRKGNAGAGIVLPFYELFGLLDFGRFNIGKEYVTLAKLAEEVYKHGYDARFGMVMAVPVVISDLSIRLIWSIRRYFQYGYELKDCVPTNVHPDLRIMLIVGNGTLCLMDGLDAGIRSGGNYLAFFMRLNYIAWLKLLKMVIKEVCIRLGLMQNALTAQIEALKRVDDAINEYISELKNYDVAGFELEIQRYNEFAEELNCVTSQEDLNMFLLNTYKDFELSLPWKGDFDEFMSDPSNQLIFE